MSRRAISLLSVGIVAACGGTTTPVTLTNPPGMVGASYSNPQAPWVEQDGTPSSLTGTADASVSIVDAKTIDVTVNGTTTRLFAGPSNFKSADGNTILSYAQGIDQISFFVRQYEPLNDITWLGGAVNGNFTSAMPTSGTAQYTGTTVTFDGTADATGSSQSGTFALNADFGTGMVSGTMTGLLPLAPGTTFDLAPIAISGYEFNTTLSTLDPNVSVAGSLVVGDFFGSNAASVGGSLYLNTNQGNVAGLFTSEP